MARIATSWVPGEKSGVFWALDADNDKLVWSTGSIELQRDLIEQPS